MVSGSGRSEVSRSAQHRQRKALAYGVLGFGVLLLVVVVAVGVTAWQAMQVRDELTAAEKLSREVEVDLRELKFAEAQSKVPTLQEHTGRARSLITSLPWKVGKRLPGYGDDVAALQTAVVAVDDLSVKVLPPLVGAAVKIDPEQLAPKDGQINLAPMASAKEPLDTAVVELGKIRTRVDRIDHGAIHPKVAENVAKLQKSLVTTAGTTKQARDVVRVAPGLLGAQGPRDILVLFQNNAEARSRGGIVGAVAVLRVDQGKFELVAQGGSADFGPFKEPVLPLGESEQLHGTRIGRYIQNVTATPHFPLSAQLATAMYQKSRIYQGTPPSAVIAMDPVALSYLLKTTGEVTLPTGDKLTGDTVVKTLLNEAYFKFANARQMDLFFAMAAASVFDKVSAGISGSGAVSALEQSVQERRLLVWSNDDAEQAVLMQYPLGGAFSYADNQPNTVGVFLNEGTSSKLSYYLKQELSLTPVCIQEGAGAATDTGIAKLAVTLTSTTPQNVASFPEYIKGNGKVGVPIGHMKVLVNLYAPKGEVFSAITVDGKPAQFASVQDQGLAVAVVEVALKPGARAVVETSFSRAAGQQLAVEATPLTSRATLTERNSCEAA